MQINTKTPIRVSGEPRIIFTSALIICAIFIVTLIRLALIGKSIFSVIVCLTIATSIFLLVIRRLILNVTFGEKNVTVKYLSGKENKFHYDSITKFYNHTEGFLPYSIIVIRYKTGKKERKITAYSPNTDLIEVIKNRKTI